MDVSPIYKVINARVRRENGHASIRPLQHYVLDRSLPIAPPAKAADHVDLNGGKDHTCSHDHCNVTSPEYLLARVLLPAEQFRKTSQATPIFEELV